MYRLMISEANKRQEDEIWQAFSIYIEQKTKNFRISLNWTENQSKPMPCQGLPIQFKANIQAFEARINFWVDDFRGEFKYQILVIRIFLEWIEYFKANMDTERFAYTTSTLWIVFTRYF